MTKKAPKKAKPCSVDGAFEPRGGKSQFSPPNKTKEGGRNSTAVEHKGNEVSTEVVQRG